MTSPMQISVHVCLKQNRYYNRWLIHNIRLLIIILGIAKTAGHVLKLGCTIQRDGSNIVKVDNIQVDNIQYFIQVFIKVIYCRCIGLKTFIGTNEGYITKET